MEKRKSLLAALLLLMLSTLCSAEPAPRFKFSQLPRGWTSDGAKASSKPVEGLMLEGPGAKILIGKALSASVKGSRQMLDDKLYKGGEIRVKWGTGFYSELSQGNLTVYIKPKSTDWVSALIKAPGKSTPELLKTFRGIADKITVVP